MGARAIKARWSVMMGTAFVLVLLLAATVSAQSYELGVGDTLRITVWGHEDLMTEVEVRPDGYIGFPLVGDLYVVGRTTGWVSNTIEKRLDNYVRDPKVTVIVSAFRTIRVQAMGEVILPGYYQMRAGARVMDLLGQAGGPRKAANLHQVSVTRSIDIGSRENAEVFHVDLNRFVERGDAASNPLLEDGDVVRFPDGGQVLILGEVRFPGSYALRSGMDLLDILAEAGGGTETADLQQSVLTRTGSDGLRREHVVDLEAAMAGQRAESAEALPDDVLYIPAQRQVILLGEVRSPGTYALQRDSSLVDVLGQVGGIGPSADPTRISITRTVNGEQFVFHADAKRPLRGEDGGDNPRIKGGDVIFVPEGQNHVLVLGEVRRPGTYTLREQADRILDVLADAGGSTDRAALSQVTVTRELDGDVQVKYFNVADMQSSGSGQTERLRPGDVLFVPEGAPQVLVLGQVQRPGSYRLGDGMRLLDVLAAAGGESAAAGSLVMLTRDEDTEEINLGSLNRLGVGNRRLQAGDIVYVAEGQRQVLVLGEVHRPGYHILNFGDRVMDGIAQAGGLTDSAAADDVTLTREQSDGEPAIFSVNVRQVMDNRYSDTNIPLEGGDVIIVPEINRRVLVLGEVRSPGYYLLREGERALDLIAKAGGMTARAEANAVRLNREHDEGAAVEQLDLTSVQEGTGGLNPLVRGGDVLYVPEARVQSLVFGEVRSPGYYPVTGTMRLLDLLAQAGGLTEAADGSKATLTVQVDGETTIREVDLERIMDSGEGNQGLQGGEMLMVPRAERDILILGEAVRPGVYTVSPGDRVLDVVARAGGPTDNADLQAASLTTAALEPQVHTINLEALYRDRTHADNRTVAGGDVLYIPQHNRRILVLGAVGRPGAHTVDRYTRVLDALAMAGGLTRSSDSGHATLTRIEDGQEVVLDLDLHAVMENRARNLEMRGGDVLFVPEAKQALVFGEVNRPGAYVVPPGGRVLDILAAAGGLHNEDRTQEIVLTRQHPEGEEVWAVDYQQLMHNQRDANHLLSGGDVIFVPETKRQLLVLGEVSNPGVYTVSSPTKLLEAISMAGGPTDRAALQSVGIYRDGVIDGDEIITFAVGEEKMLFEGDATENPEVIGGDIIYVPETGRPDWGRILGFLNPIRTFQQILGGWPFN